MIIATALACLSLNLFHEARSEPIMGRYAVALVTMNRAQDHKRVCTEVFKPKQFSWTTGVQKTAAGWKIPVHLRPNLQNPIDATSWWYAQRIAQATLDGRMFDFTRGAEFYHTAAVNPHWAKSFKVVKRIGQHIFYVREE